MQAIKFILMQAQLSPHTEVVNISVPLDMNAIGMQHRHVPSQVESLNNKQPLTDILLMIAKEHIMMVAGLFLTKYS
jgi:hypothetical protein